MNYKNITRIKHITNKEVGRAYLDIEEKIFDLKYPERHKKSILDSDTDELIILYQKIENDKTLYLTHLVKPVDNIMTDDGDRENFKYGRIVETISFPGENNKIRLKSTPLSNFSLNNKGWGRAEKLEHIIEDSKQLENVQKQLWNQFRPYFSNDLKDNTSDYQTFLNDELDDDFPSNEGKEMFKKHRIRERDSRLTRRKKEKALQEGKLDCEVCKFSFKKEFDQYYIECHHIVPIHLGERITNLEDLALVCSNCHRMLHRKINGKFLSIEELKEIRRT